VLFCMKCTSKKENTKKSPLYDIYNISYKFYQNNLNTVYGKDAKKYLLNRKIDEDVRLIFITTSNEFASESYEVKAEDYLIKRKGLKMMI